MATKIVRVYLSTFIDVEQESENFVNDEEMQNYVISNLSDYIDVQQLYDNVAEKPTDVDVINAEEL